MLKAFCTGEVTKYPAMNSQAHALLFWSKCVCSSGRLNYVKSSCLFNNYIFHRSCFPASSLLQLHTLHFDLVSVPFCEFSVYAWEKATLLLGSVLFLVLCSWSAQGWGERL